MTRLAPGSPGLRVSSTLDTAQVGLGRFCSATEGSFLRDIETPRPVIGCRRQARWGLLPLSPCHMTATADVDLQRPSLSLLASEPIRAAFEFVWHQLSSQPDSPQDDGHAVVLFPGLGSNGTAMIPLFLQRERGRLSG